MIYRREFPNAPAKRFRTTLLNPIGSVIIRKHFYKNNQKLVGKHQGTKVCLRRKKTRFITKFNLCRGIYQPKHAVIFQISLSRRYKTSAGLIRYSNGAISVLSLFNGAAVGATIQVIKYLKNPKIYFFTRFKTGDYVPVAYISIMNCFFNITHSRQHSVWFCTAPGTFCTLIKINMNKGYCTIRLPSNKYLIILESCYVTLGRNANILPKGVWVGKAGININKGFRPAVRGVAKNPIDHPHGGRTKSNSPERTPWGRVAKFNK